jgi:hypothetical protein
MYEKEASRIRSQLEGLQGGGSGAQRVQRDWGGGAGGVTGGGVTGGGVTGGGVTGAMGIRVAEADLNRSEDKCGVGLKVAIHNNLHIVTGVRTCARARVCVCVCVRACVCFFSRALRV